MENCCNHKLKSRSEDEKKYFKTRLKTIEGQVRGIANMIDEDRYCNDILIQLLAINKSIKCISNDLLKSHMNSCVIDKIKNNDLSVIDEVMELIRRIES